MSNRPKFKEVKSTKVDMDKRKKKNEISKVIKIKEEKRKEYLKNKKKEEENNSRVGSVNFKKGGTKSTTKKVPKKGKKGKKELKKCELAAGKAGCHDITCICLHAACKEGLDCNKKECSFIHKNKYLDKPTTKEENLIYLRISHYIIQKASTNGTQKAVGKYTFLDLATKLKKTLSPRTFKNIRSDWTWIDWGKNFGEHHKLEEGKLTNPELTEEDVAHFYQFFLHDLREHFYQHEKEYRKEIQNEEEEEEEEEKDENEKEEEEKVTEFDNEKIDKVLNTINLSTKSIVVNFPQLIEEKKLIQASRCWKFIFQARVTKAFLDLDENEAILVLDNLIGYIEKGKKENDVVLNKTFRVDPELLNMVYIDCVKEISFSWKKFIKGKSLTEIVEDIHRTLGAVPSGYGDLKLDEDLSCPGIKTLPLLLYQISQNLKIYDKVNSTKEDYINAVKSFYQKTSWSFNLAEILLKNDSEFFKYPDFEEVENYGPLFADFKEKIVQLWGK